jgi:N6-L-threonylcarbamoyladenine synthase
MRILGIETSCDETGAAVIEGTTKDQPVIIHSNIVSTSLAMHAATGGIIPEIAAREQVKYILPVIEEALGEKAPQKPDIDAIAVTFGPGLIGSLLVGVETAKTLSMLWKVPLIPVNHMHGHIYANFIGEFPISNIQLSTLPAGRQVSNENKKIPDFPAIALVVSGGHTDLVILKDQGDMEVIGGTRDDAAGEAFDKIGRLLGLSYPAGPVISRLAEKGNPKAFQLPRPMWDSKDFDFSFSGLKTSVLNLIKRNSWDFSTQQNEQLLADLCASVQKAIVDVLVFKTTQAVQQHGVSTLLLGGGVAANIALKEAFEKKCSEQGIQLFIPSAKLSTDNGAMIAAAGFYNDTKVSWKDVTANPELYY